jgi:hypothetical protein
MSNILDVTGGIQQVLTNFGLGASWDLAKCSYIAPSGAISGRDSGSRFSLGTSSLISDVIEAERTVTFLDTGVLNSLDLSVFPTVELAKNFLVNYLTKANADRSGRTLLSSLNTKVENNIISYQLPSGKQIPRTWGTKFTKFQVNTMICGYGYLDKVKRLVQLASYNSDLTGGTFNHPIYGTFNNTHISDVTIKEDGTVFNGSLLTITFISSDTYTKNKSEETSTEQQTLALILGINSVVQGLATSSSLLSRIQAILQPILPSGETIQLETSGVNSIEGVINSGLGSSNDSWNTPPSDGADNTAEIVGGKLTVKYNEKQFNSPIFTEDVSVAMKIIVSDTYPDLVVALSELKRLNINVDFNWELNVQLIMNYLCSYAEISVEGYGDGFISDTTTTTEQTTNIVNLVYYTESTDNRGNIVTVEKQIVSETSGVYTIEVNTTTNILLNTPTDILTIQGYINEVISFLSVMVALESDKLQEISNLVASIENLFEVAKLARGVSITLDRQESISSLAIVFNTTVKDILAKNPQLIANKPLLRGMVLEV